MARQLTLQTSRPTRITHSDTAARIELDTGQVMSPVRLLRETPLTVEFRWDGERHWIARHDYNSLAVIGVA